MFSYIDTINTTNFRYKLKIMKIKIPEVVPRDLMLFDLLPYYFLNNYLKMFSAYNAAFTIPMSRFQEPLITTLPAGYICTALNLFQKKHLTPTPESSCFVPIIRTIQRRLIMNTTAKLSTKMVQL